MYLNKISMYFLGLAPMPSQIYANNRGEEYLPKPKIIDGNKSKTHKRSSSMSSYYSQSRSEKGDHQSDGANASEDKSQQPDGKSADKDCADYGDGSAYALEDESQRSDGSSADNDCDPTDDEAALPAQMVYTPNQFEEWENTNLKHHHINF